MHSSPHRNNSDFQLRHFMANSCHTADVAWCLMYEQKLDISLKLESTKAKLLRRKIKKIELDKLLESENELVRLNAEADLIEWKANEGLLEMAILGAEQELSTIQNILDELEPQRKFSHLPLLEASQAAQREEWLCEFQMRIENYLMSTGSIPEDQLSAMRKHPDFETKLVPYVQEVMLIINNSQDKLSVLKNNKPLLLESSNAS